MDRTRRRRGVDSLWGDSHSVNRISFGRVYTAYGGIFIVLAILWGMVFDGWKPDRFDIVGAAFELVGVSIIMWGRLLFR